MNNGGALRSLLAALVLTVSAQFAAEAQMSDRDFFALVDQDYPGLGAVKTALIAGDTSLAKTELLRYYQNRTSRVYFTLGSGGSTSEADDNISRYFTVIGIRKYAGSADGSIDWTVKDAVDNEWHWQFHRMYWLTNYAKVYAGTRAEKYAVACVADMVDWARDNTSGYPRTLDTGIRLKNWVESYQYLVPKYRSASVSAEDHALLLKSMIMQCQFLRDNWRSAGNWGASETQGLGAAVTMFPELKFSASTAWTWWKDQVISRLQHHLSGDFYADGVQFETSPSYACLEYRNLFLAYQLMSMNGIAISDELRNLFVKPLEYMMHIHKPDGYLPQLSDTEKNEYRNYLEDGADLFARTDMRFAATEGGEGTPPTSTFGAFPNGGLFTMRDTWGTGSGNFAGSKYMVFDLSSNVPGHAHYDILTFEAHINGLTVIRDAGKYTYVSGTWRDYFKGTPAHNTIVVDGKNQSSSKSGVSEYWCTTPGFDYVVASHEAYSGLTVQRSIFFAKPNYWIISDLVTGTGTHTYDSYLHLDPSLLSIVTLDPGTRTLTAPQFRLFASDTTVDTGISSGWTSDKYNVKLEAPVLRHRKAGTPPVAFESILVPAGTVPVTGAVRQPVTKGAVLTTTAEAVCVKIALNGWDDWFLRSNARDSLLQFGPFTGNGRSVFVSVAPNGSVIDLKIADGTLLFKEGELLYDSHSTFASVSYGGTAVHAAGSNITYLRVWAPQFDTLLVNGISVATVKADGYLTYGAPTAVAERIPLGTPGAFWLEQNYPNPFNPATTIRFSLGVSAEVDLRVFDILGRQVATLARGQRKAGIHLVPFDGTGLGSGVLFVRLIIDGQQQTRRILLTK